MTLTKEEREKFASWCESQARDAEAIIEQIKKLGPHGEIIAHRQKQEAIAAIIIAVKLRSIEDMNW